MNYKDVLIKLASMTIPYVYDDTVSFLELDRKLYKIVHELIIAMQGLNSDYEQFKTDMTNSFNEFTTTINNNFDKFKSDVNNQIKTFDENITGEFNTFKTEIESNFNTLEGKFNTLKDYVDNYFANLNLDEEVQAVIQKMVDDGTLANIINNELLGDINNQITQINQEIEQLQNNQIKSLDLNYAFHVNKNVYYNSEVNNSAPNGTILYVTLNGEPTLPTSKVSIGNSASSTIDVRDKNMNTVTGNMVKDGMNLILIKTSLYWQVINTLPSEYDTSELEGKVEENTTNISTLQSQVATNTSNISKNTEALDIMNAQTSITDTSNIDTSELTKGDSGASDNSRCSACNIQISTNEDKTRYLITGMLGLSGNPGGYNGNIKIPLNSAGSKTGKCLGSALLVNFDSSSSSSVLNAYYFTTSVTQTHLLINFENINLRAEASFVYLPMVEVIYG